MSLAPLAVVAGDDGRFDVVDANEWYWCLTHSRAERRDDRDDPDNSLGPYPDEAGARDWKRINEERAAAWKAQDEAWEGEDPDP